MKTKKVLQLILIDTMIMFLGMMIAGRWGLLIGLGLSLFLFWLCLRDDLPHFFNTQNLSPLRGQDPMGLRALSRHGIYIVPAQDVFICSGTFWLKEHGWILISESLIQKIKPDELKALVSFHSRWVDARFGFWTRLSACLFISFQNFISQTQLSQPIRRVAAALLTFLVLLPSQKSKVLQALNGTPEFEKKSLAFVFDRLKSYAINIPAKTPEAFDFVQLHPQRPCRQLSNPYIRQLVGYEPI